MAAKDPFQAVHAALRRDPRGSEMEMFGARGFKVNGKVFAIFWKGDLVLKMPEPRAQELVATRVAKAWDPGHGRKMKEWIAFPPRTGGRWVRLAEEARDFVAVGALGRKGRERRARSK